MELKVELSRSEWSGVYDQVEAALSSVIEYSESYELNPVEAFEVKNQIKGLEKLLDALIELA